MSDDTTRLNTLKWKIEDFDKEDGVLVSFINLLPDSSFLPCCEKLLNNIGLGINVFFINFETDEKKHVVVSAYLNVGDDDTKVSKLEKEKLVLYLKAASNVYLLHNPQDSVELRSIFDKAGYILG